GTRPGPGVPEYAPAFLGAHEPVPRTGGVCFVPACPLVGGHRVDVEGDRAVDDVVVVDGSEPLEIGWTGGANVDGHAAHHAKAVVPAQPRRCLPLSPPGRRRPVPAVPRPPAPSP